MKWQNVRPMCISKLNYVICRNLNVFLYCICRLVKYITLYQTIAWQAWYSNSIKSQQTMQLYSILSFCGTSLQTVVSLEKVTYVWFMTQSSQRFCNNLPWNWVQMDALVVCSFQFMLCCNTNVINVPEKWARVSMKILALSK